MSVGAWSDLIRDDARATELAHELFGASDAKIGHTLLGTTYMYSESTGVKIERRGGLVINGLYVVGRQAERLLRAEYDKKRDEIMANNPVMQCLQMATQNVKK